MMSARSLGAAVLFNSFPCGCRTRSSALCLLVPPLPEYVLQGILVAEGLCSRCLRLRFRDRLSSTIRPVCPWYVPGGGEAGSRT